MELTAWLLANITTHVILPLLWMRHRLILSQTYKYSHKTDFFPPFVCLFVCGFLSFWFNVSFSVENMVDIFSWFFILFFVYKMCNDLYIFLLAVIIWYMKEILFESQSLNSRWYIFFSVWNKLLGEGNDSFWQFAFVRVYVRTFYTRFYFLSWNFGPNSFIILRHSFKHWAFQCLSQISSESGMQSIIGILENMILTLT